MTLQQGTNSKSPCCEAAPSRLWQFLALGVSVIALSGSLYLSMGMKLKACPLCLYERTFMMALAGVLFLGVLHSRAAKPGFSILLCLPLVIGGLGVAAFHVYLELTGVLECPAGLLSLGSAPMQSLGAYLVVSALLGIALSRSSAGSTWLVVSLGAVALGVLFSVAAIMSAPPLPSPPTEAYTTPLEGCRPPFQSDGRAR